MKVVTARQAHKKLGRVLDEAQHEPVTICKNGRPYCVILSARDFEQMDAVHAAQDEAKWERLFASPRSESLLAELADEARQEIENGTAMPGDPFMPAEG